MPFDPSVLPPRSDRGKNAVLDGDTVARALHAANNLVVITDAHQDDNPIVWVNDYFCEFTGYSRDEVIGRNCRFLQGNDRDQAERYQLRRAVDEQQRTHVLLRNYRKDGSLFYNDLYVSPVHDDDGKVRYFIGVQNDATARILAQTRAAEHEREVQETAENERERFGMDLHDGLGQTLAGATMLSHALTNDLLAISQRDGVLQALPDELLGRIRTLADHAETLHNHIEETVGEARNMAYGLNPVDASPRGLGDALRRLAEAVRESGSGERPKIHVQAEDVEFPDRRQARHLYRIAQEAIANALRHADSDTIRVTLHRIPQGVSLEVADDGAGIDPDAARPDALEGGRGLASIRYRAALIGASVEIGAPAAGGTAVRVVIPNETDDAPQHRRLTER